MQGAGQTHGAVVAFYATLQRLPPDNLIRVVQIAWPLAEAELAWATWQAYNVRLNVPAALPCHLSSHYTRT